MSNALFNLNWYLAQNPDVAAAVQAGLVDGFTHFEMYGKYEGRSYNPLFNEQDYLARNPGVAEAVMAGLTTAYDHFVSYGLSENREPFAGFDSEFYLSQNPDVAAAVRSGVTTAVQHFMTYGQHETRPFTPHLDMQQYLDANPDVRAAVEAGFITAMGHFMTHGITEGRDLGNGINLGMFANDPVFTEALASGNFAGALERVGEVAPFIPSFERPAGWSPAADTPIPTDFVPPAGLQLQIPTEVSIPPGTKLPDSFAPVNSGGGDSGGGNTGGGNTGGGNTGGGDTGGGDTGGGDTGGGDTGGGDTGGGKGDDFTAILDEDNFVVFENAPAGSITVESAVREDDELVITFQSSAGTTQLSVPVDTIEGISIGEGNTLVLSNLSELSSLVFVGAGDLQLVGTANPDSYFIQTTGAVTVNAGAGADAVRLGAGSSTVVFTPAASAELVAARNEAMETLEQHKADFGTYEALAEEQQALEGKLATLSGLQQQAAADAANLDAHIEAFGENPAQNLTDAQEELAGLLEGTSVEVLEEELEQAQQAAEHIQGLRETRDEAATAWQNFLQENELQDNDLAFLDLLSTQENAKHNLDQHKDLWPELEDLESAEAQLGVWQSQRDEIEDLTAQHTASVQAQNEYVEAHGTITELGQNILTANNNHQNFLQENEEILSQRTALNDALAQLPSLRDNLDTASAALAAHIGEYGDVRADYDEQAQLIAQYATDNGSRADLEAEKAEIPGKVAEHGDLVVARDTAQSALEAHAVYGSTAELSDDANSKANALSDFIAENGDEDVLTQKIADFTAAVTDRATLTQAKADAQAAIATFFTTNNLADRTELESKLQAEEGLFDDLSDLNTAYSNADSALTGHITVHGEDEELPVKLSLAESALAAHKTDNEYESRQDLADELAQVQADLANDPENNELLAQEEALVSLLEEHDELVDAIAEAQQALDARPALRQAFDEAKEARDDFIAEHGDAEAINARISTWQSLVSDLDALENAYEQAEDALNAHVESYGADPAAALDTWTSLLETADQLRTASDVADDLLKTRLQLEEDATKGQEDLDQFEQNVGTPESLQARSDAIDVHLAWYDSQDDILEALDLLVIARAALEENEESAYTALNTILATWGDEEAIGAALADIDSMEQPYLDAIEEAQALYEGLNELINQTSQLLGQISQLEATYGTVQQLTFKINNLTTAIETRPVLEAAYEAATANVNAYTSLKEALDNAESAIEEALVDGDPQDRVIELTETLERISELQETVIPSLTEAVNARVVLVDLATQSSTTLASFIDEFGSQEALNEQLQSVKSLIDVREQLQEAFEVAHTAYVTSLGVSDSPATGGWDIITNFQVGTHTIDTGLATVLDEFSNDDVSITNGIATFNNAVTMEQALLTLSEITEGQPQAVAFGVEDSESLFVFVSDGVSGLGESDTLIELVGSTGDSLYDILGSAA